MQCVMGSFFGPRALISECEVVENTMKIVFVRPKEVIDLVAGMIGMLFDQLDGEMPIEMEMEGVAEGDPVAQAEPAPDDLTKINGIGPAFARRLAEAGINSYADLAGLTAEEVRERTQLKEWQGDPEDWIDQARALSAS
jgi:hypothetical protein